VSATPLPGTWGACRFCGVAVPSGAKTCEICGAEAPLSAAELRTAPRSVRRRLAWTGLLRSLVVVVVIAGLGYAIVSAVLTGPPNVPDPLTTSGAYTLAPGAETVISGEITGGDYVVGNFSSVSPAGASVALAVYNSSGWSAYVGHGPATPVYSIGASGSARIVYSAPYTDTFYFVFTNPYPPSSALNVTVYIVTEYQSNVGDDGFS
jgi:hypothetical protein